MILVKGNVYRFSSRNLELGVCIQSDPDAEPAYARFLFTGVREKFGNRYLSTEYGWNITEDLGPLPEGMSDQEYLVRYSEPNVPLFDYLEGLR